MGLTVNKAQEVIGDSISRSFQYILERMVEVPTNVNKIVTLVGSRRAGKTSICFQLIKSLRMEVSADRLLYVNFEDDRFFPVELSDMDLLLETYYSMYPGNRNKMVWFFFDEVQEVLGWEKFVRRIHDQENCRIYITGPSSRLLSRELSTTLRGRTLSYEVFPLSFKEYLAFNKLEYDQYSSRGKSVLQNHLIAYIKQGGFPELVFLDEQFHRPTLNEYLNLMLYKDLTERFGIRNPQLLKYLLKFCLINLSNSISINKLYNDLKSQGYKISKNTLYEYLAYLEEAFVIFKVSKWSKSIRGQNQSSDKIYALDQGFKYALTGRGDEGRILENLVFMALRRLGTEVFYMLNKQEVDFYLEGKKLINVCLDMSEKSTSDRELKGLNEGMEATGMSESLLVTLNDDDEIDLTNGKVTIVPARKFLLEPERYV